jgi:hypothetical protein
VIDRTEPPWVERERPMLLGWLEYHRSTLAFKCEGLSNDQLCLRSVPPSSMSLIGLVRHMAGVERGWFRQAFVGEGVADLYEYEPRGIDEAFDVLDPNAVDASLQTWHEECETARAIVSRHSLDDLSITPYAGRSLGLRWVVSHMIEEYARHNGHADLLREAVDGSAARGR